MEIVLVGIICVIALGYVLRTFYKVVKGDEACSGCRQKDGKCSCCPNEGSGKK